MGISVGWALVASTIASAAVSFATRPDTPNMQDAQDYYADKTTPMEVEETEPVEFGESDESKQRKAAGKLQFQVEKETPVNISTTGTNIKPDKPTGVQF